MIKPAWSHKRVSVYWPGKHGERDCRVEFAGKAPTHAEIVAMVGWIFWAERRYDKPGAKGPLWLMDFLDRALHAESQREFEDILQEVEGTKPSVTCSVA